MLRFGPADGPLVLVAPALFEEANRTRAFTVGILRLLAGHGMASVLPDLPGQGESSLPTHEARLTDWRNAFASVAAAVQRERSVSGIVSIRGGALVDTLVPVTARWHLSPISGDDVIRDLRRVRHLSSGTKPNDGGNLVEVAGNLLSPTLLDELSASAVRPARVVRLETDSRDADRKVPGVALWRTSEPTTNGMLSRILADDIVEWVEDCAA